MRYLQETKAEKKVVLDAKDKKILAILAMNSRTPVSSIAKKVGLSRDAIKYRIDQMHEKGLVQGYRTVINIDKFGSNYHLFLQLDVPTKEVEESFVKKLQNYSFVRAILKFSGKYDYEIALVAKDLKDLNDIMDKISNECEHIKTYVLMAITKSYVARVFPKKLIDYEIHKKRTKGQVKINKKDLQILKEIGEDASIPLYKIASKVKLSPDAVNYRMKKMIDANIITGFIPVINFAAISYNVYAILLNLRKMNSEKENKLKSFLNNDKNILWAVKCLGQYNSIIYVCSKSTEELHDTMTALRRLFPEEIKEYEALIAFEEFKYKYFPECLLE